jgi:hypothetical protein
METKTISLEELRTKYKSALEKKPRQRGGKWKEILAKVADGKPAVVEGVRMGQVAGLRLYLKRNELTNIVMLVEPTGEDPTITESKNKTINRIVFVTTSDYEKIKTATPAQEKPARKSH